MSHAYHCLFRNGCVEVSYGNEFLLLTGNSSKSNINFWNFCSKTKTIPLQKCSPKTYFQNFTVYYVKKWFLQAVFFNQGLSQALVLQWNYSNKGHPNFLQPITIVEPKKRSSQIYQGFAYSDCAKARVGEPLEVRVSFVRLLTHWLLDTWVIFPVTHTYSWRLERVHFAESKQYFSWNVIWCNLCNLGKSKLVYEYSHNIGISTCFVTVMYKILHISRYAFVFLLSPRPWLTS